MKQLTLCALALCAMPLNHLALAQIAPPPTATTPIESFAALEKALLGKDVETPEGEPPAMRLFQDVSDNIIARLSPKDAERIFQEIRTRANDRKGEDIQSADIAKRCAQFCLAALAKEDAERAWNLALEMVEESANEESNDANNALYPIVRVWGAIAPEDALKKIAQSNPRLSLLVKGVLESLARKDPARAVKLACGVRTYYGRLALCQVFNLWATQDSSAAQAALRELDPAFQPIAAAGIIEALSRQEPATALKLISEFPSQKNLHSNTGNDYAQTAIMSLAEQDPQAAFDATQSLKIGGGRATFMVRDVIAAWATKNFPAAEKCVEAISDRDMFIRGIEGLASAPGGDCKKLFAILLDKYPVGERVGDAFYYLADKWGKSAPEAAAEAFKSLPAGRVRANALDRLEAATLANAANNTQPPAQLPPPQRPRNAQAQPAQKSPHDKMTSLYLMLQSDPRKALAEAFLDPGLTIRFVTPIFQAWAQKDLTTARSEAKKIDLPPAVKKLATDNAKDIKDMLGEEEAVRKLLREMAYAGIMAYLLTSDPAAAWAYIADAPPPSNFMSFGKDKTDNNPALRQQVIGPWAQRNPQAALAALKTAPQAEYEQLFPILIKAWATKDFSAALRYVLTLDDLPTLVSALSALAKSPNVNCPEFFKLLAERLPIDDSFLEPLGNLVYPWSQRDPRAALEAFGKLPAADRNYSVEIIRHWGSSAFDKNEPLDWLLANMQPSELRTECLQTIFRAWGSEDATSALAATQKLTAPERQAVFPSILIPLVRENPIATLDILPTLPPANVVVVSENVLCAIPHTQALAFVETLSDAWPKENLTSKIVTNWAAWDARSANDWTQKLPDGSLKNRCLIAVARSLVYFDARAATLLAASIPDTGLAKKTLDFTFKEWEKYDPDAAQAWKNQ